MYGAGVAAPRPEFNEVVSPGAHIMKLAFLMATYLGRIGGAEIHARRLVEEWARRGHTVEVFAVQAGAGTSARGESNNVRVIPLARDPDREENIRRRWQLWSRRGIRQAVQLIPAAGTKGLWTRGGYCPDLDQPDLFRGYDALIHFHSAASCWLYQVGRLLPRLGGLPTVGVPLFHVREMGGTMPMQRYWHRGYRAIMTNTPFETAALRAARWRNPLIDAVGVGSDVWTGSVDPAGFRQRCGIPPEAPLVLFIGRKIFNKGAAHMVQAMDRVWARFPEARLVLLGYSHNPPEWLAGYVRQGRAGAADRVIDLDDVDDQTREDALAACTVFAMPSISDSFGIAYLDAWRYGKPVIGCRDTCAESVIQDQVDGRLVEFGNLDQLAGAITDLLDDPVRAQALGNRGRLKGSDRYTWSAVSDRAEAFLQRIRAA